MDQGGGGGGEVVEEASPISSRPPANFEELMRFSAADYDGGGSSSSGIRWPMEETLALLRIRSDMDSIFRDATLKAPLWEDVSRKLSELGYKRSAKKCKEKFENVQKYYKRTKEARGGRQDGKAYKFFAQLEALNAATAAANATAPSTLNVVPLSVANPIQTPSSSPFSAFPPPPPPAVGGVTFSSHSSSTDSGMGSDDDDDDLDMDVDAAGPSSRKRKRKRGHRHRGGSSSNSKLMDFFGGLVREVLQKQAAMQRSFIEALEKREQERIDREEAWKRQEMFRLAREQELLAQDRAASASRDSAILSLIQKITGHTIQLPPPPPQLWPPPPTAAAAKPAPPPFRKMKHTHHQHSRASETHNVQSQSPPIMAIPQQQIPPQMPEKHHDQVGGSSDPASSRWPKVEVFALINLRSGLEPRYQEAAPKGPLWEEISSAMKRMGYNRSAKRCKEKWENINKYYKKVKESNKKRPEDAKTCPYFHRLDALYSKKDQTSSPFSTSRTPESVKVQTHLSASISDQKRKEEHMEESTQEGVFREGGAEKKTL
ncbi:PREDICTED: trihelix transcription factor GTL1-like isoform X2 [Tarenaya hassleriana]|uniref:trihelix transcription factor GTL1-like isoform X2 n=1 Tax=Tarenaya hassleriana TaxID=28532 RepID=UPI00053C647C|nr:PREDICTED: trihelix transcription factor GTL1-like isoform X2 [Tarenaya hassleriana]